VDDGSVRDVVVQGNLNSWFWMRVEKGCNSDI